MNEEGSVPVTFYGNHNRTILEIFNKQRDDPSFHEVTVKINERDFYGHRALLCALSPYFNGALTNDTTEKRICEIQLSADHVTTTAMQLIMDYIYTAAVKIDHENAGSLLSAANYLQMDEIKTYCQEFLSNHLNPENSLTTLSSALMSDSDELTENAELVIKQHFETVLEQEEFLELEKDFVVKIFNLIDQDTQGAKEIYEALVKWVKHNIAERQEDFPELLKKIKLHFFPIQYLRKTVSSEPLVKNCVQCKAYLQQLTYRQVVMPALVKEQPHPKKKKYASNNNYFVVVGDLILLYDILYESFTILPTFIKTDQEWIYCVHQYFLYAIGSNGSIMELNIFNPCEGWHHAGRTIKNRQNPSALSFNGVIIITGGKGEKSVETFDPICKGQFLLSPMPEVRFSHTMVERFGCLLCIGGYNPAVEFGFKNICKSINVFKPKLQRWDDFSEKYSLAAISKAVMLEDSLFVVRKNLEIVRYDEGNGWKKWAKASSSENTDVAVVAKEDQFIVASSIRNSTTLDIHLYEPFSNRWKKFDKCYKLGFACGDILSF